MNRASKASLSLAATCILCGCESPAPSTSHAYEYLPAYRSPSQMRNSYGLAQAPAGPSPHRQMADDQTTGEIPQVPLHRPLPKQEPTPSASEVPTPAPSDVIETARDKATQHPTPHGFINAVQVYQYVPGAVYEVVTAPLFATMLRLRPGEELKNLAAGDTSRWIIDIVGAGNADSDEHQLWPQERQPEPGIVHVLIKPRFPMIKTNLFITTNERVYIIDLQSTEETYHSVIEWTYPRRMAIPLPASSAPPAPVTAPQSLVRNYVYSLKAPVGGPPPWAPKAVYDDGHRVYIDFDPSINDLRRPPLYLLDSSGMARMVNYRTEANRYVVDELFDRAALRIGEERVVIQRTLPRPATAETRPGTQ